MISELIKITAILALLYWAFSDFTMEAVLCFLK